MQTPTTDDTPQRNAITLLFALSGHLVLTAAGGWVLYQSAITDMNATVEYHTEQIIERLEPKIDANGARIDALGERVERNSVLIARIGERVDRNAELIMRNAERIDRNGELITQLRERMTAVEVRVGGLEEVVRFFHPPDNQSQQEP